MYLDLDMEVVDTFVANNNVVTMELGLDMRGNTMYRVAWFNGRKWQHGYYRRQKDAWTTFRMIMGMIGN